MELLPGCGLHTQYCHLPHIPQPHPKGRGGGEVVPNGVLSIEVLQYETVYCGPNGVLSIEVLQYETAYCGPNGVLSIEVHRFQEFPTQD